MLRREDCDDAATGSDAVSALHEAYRHDFDTIPVGQEDSALRNEAFRLRY